MPCSPCDMGSSTLLDQPASNTSNNRRWGERSRPVVAEVLPPSAPPTQAPIEHFQAVEPGALRVQVPTIAELPLAAFPTPFNRLSTTFQPPFSTTSSASTMARFSNPLATPSQLLNRSSLWALPQDLQEVVFIATQSLTQAAGLQLELPQSVTSQANVILARYWLIDSPMAHEFSVRLPTSP